MPKAVSPMTFDIDRIYSVLDWCRLYLQQHLFGTSAIAVLLGIVSLMAIEACYRDWKDTAMYRVFIRRSTSAKIDIVFWLMQSAGLTFLFGMAFSLGLALL